MVLERFNPDDEMGRWVELLERERERGAEKSEDVGEVERGKS